MGRMDFPLSTFSEQKERLPVRREASLFAWISFLLGNCLNSLTHQSPIPATSFSSCVALYAAFGHLCVCASFSWDQWWPVAQTQS